MKYLTRLSLCLSILLIFSCQPREDVLKAKKTTVPVSSVDAKFKDEMKKLLSHYNALKEACVNDDTKAAKSIAEIMKKFVENIDISKLNNDDFYKWSKEQGNISFGLDEIISNPEIANIRLNFSELYTPIYKLMIAYGMGEETVYVQECPMAFDFGGAKWFSMEDDIENPYFGDDMLNCGSNIEVVSFE